MYLSIALGTSIVSSFTSTTSKASRYDSFLPSTCDKQLVNHPNAEPAMEATTGLDLIVEEADGEDVLVLGHSVGHGQVSQRVPQQQHVGPTLQLSEARHE